MMGHSDDIRRRRMLKVIQVKVRTKFLKQTGSHNVISVLKLKTESYGGVQVFGSELQYYETGKTEDDPQARHEFLGQCHPPSACWAGHGSTSALRVFKGVPLGVGTHILPPRYNRGNEEDMGYNKVNEEDMGYNRGNEEDMGYSRGNEEDMGVEKGK